MKIVMTLLVRDEDDIIRANLDFHFSRGVGHAIVMDNLSQDGTAAILRAYEGRGLVTLLRQTEDDYAQGRWVTQMARLAATRFAADWVINNDADEFWYPLNGTLKEVLGAVDAGIGAIKVERTNFIPPDPSSNGDFAETMTIRHAVSTNALGAPLPGKTCHRGFADIEVAQGNHSVTRNGVPLPVGVAPIEILHFPLRGYERFANKIMKGGAAYERNTQLAVQVGGTWRHLYAQARQGRLREAYEANLIRAEAVEAGLQAGTLVHDMRLRSALDDLRRGSGAERP